jgi:hypothetical protein
MSRISYTPTAATDSVTVRTRHFCLPASLQGLLEPVAWKQARPVLRGPRRGNAPGLPDEAQFEPLRTFLMGDSNHPNHTVLARRLHAYLRWRNANARHPDVLAAQRHERARIRSERQQRWGRPRPKAA